MGWGLVVLAGIAAQLGMGPTFVERVESPVYEASGSPSELAGRAVTCMGEKLKPGVITAPTIVAQDLAAGRVVANNAFEYGEGGWLGSTYRARSRMIFEAREGRFRIVHTEIEALIFSDWEPISEVNKRGAAAARAAMQAISDEIAACVKQPAAVW